MFDILMTKYVFLLIFTSNFYSDGNVFTKKKKMSDTKKLFIILC